MRRNLIIYAIVLVVAAVILLIATPKKLGRIVPAEGMTELFYEFDTADGTETVRLTSAEQERLKEVLAGARYRSAGDIKALSWNRLCIRYEDMTLIKIDNRRITVVTESGTESRSVRLYYAEELFAFFPSDITP